MKFLRKCWLPFSWSHELKNRPITRTIIGTKLVAYRDLAGRAVVMEDRCAHRGVALSEGHIIDGCIMCPYHGWRYDHTGRCVRVPSLLREEPLPDFRVPVYDSQEHDGTIWVVLSNLPHTTEPPRWLYPHAKNHTAVVEVEGNYVYLMENLVDNPHAGFIHAGLIRNEPCQRVTAEITEAPRHIRIRTIGEKTNDSILFKLLGKRGEEVDHVEEYVAPNEMISTYSQRGYLAGVQSFIVPIDEHRTRWFFRTFLCFGPMTNVVFPIYRRIVFRILMQDAEAVRKVDEQDRLWPNRQTRSTRSDTASVLVARAARAFAADGPPADFTNRTRTVEYLL
jgi:phenylpropionate dioxygenase-like ring-hydroxylating dioxygenase large terminal subunit